MRKKLIITLLFSLTISLFVIHHHEHIHAIDSCPNCGSTNINLTMSQLPIGCEDPGFETYECADCFNVWQNSLPAVGHNWGVASIVTAATCNSSGSSIQTCSRCGTTRTNTIAPLGHNYVITSQKEATCLTSGFTTYKCSRCVETYTNNIAALGHDYEYEEVDASCNEEGHKIGICKRCNDKTEEIFPALGHDMADPVIVQEATCTKDGLKEGICKRCEEKISEIIPMLGHDFGDWVIQVEATYFKEGLQFKTCSRCDERLEETIAKLNPTPLITKAGIGVVGLGIVGSGIYFGLTKSGIIGKKIVKNVVEAAGKKFIPKFETKTIITTFKDYKLFELLKKQRYLSVKTCDFASLDSSIEENEPHLIIIDVLSDEHLNELVDIINDEENENKFAFLVHPDVLNDHKDELDGLKKNKKFIGYVSILDDPYLGLVKLILPILKPEIKSDETLENIGGIADALGVPGISKIIDVYISGRDIKATLDEGELGISEDASIISNIASILGFDTIASVTGLVEDINDIKTAVDKESGLSEEVDGVEAAKDVVEVISDLINKE
ncbi:MAG: hypothetical protein IJH31_06590 [Erysipelotrichaceae bacterium]|nr:hypothetical protein [Erysipelotrichaceae bacterium]